VSFEQSEGLGPEDEWSEEDSAALCADLDRLFPCDEAMRAHVERFIEAASHETNETEPDDETE
jgi:hypothetical protein